MLKHIDNPKKKAFLVQRLLGFCCSGRARDHKVGHCGPQMFPGTRLLIKHLKCLWQGAPYMRYRLVVS